MRFQPQLASPGPTLLSGPNWIVERKWDGMRALFEIEETETRIFSRTGQDLLPQFPELQRLHEILPPCVLDGEIVAIGPDGVEDLELLQMRLGDKQARRMSEIPVTVKFFDILEAGGLDLRDRHFALRRRNLEELVGLAFCTEILSHGEKIEVGDIPSFWEGVISKDQGSRYESGKRRRTWSKFKFVRRATLRVTGLTAGKGARASSFGALTASDANGVHRGQVGSGFNETLIREIEALWDLHLAGLQPAPLIEVEYRFASKTGLMVNTAYKGVRRDKVEADADLG